MTILADLSRRRRAEELMDRPDLSELEHRAALAGLQRINRVSCAAGLFWAELAAAARPDRALSVLDVGCGGGDVLVALAARARRAGVALELRGCDLSERALDVARERASRAGVTLRLERTDVLARPLARGADAVISSLFLHHLDDEDAPRLLAHMAAVAGRMVLVQDLDRSRAGLALASVAPRLLTRSYVVHHDALRSVEQAFTAAEALALAERAGLEGARVRRAFPCRWLLAWRRAA